MLPVMMERHKKRRLEAAGWKVGSAEEFLGLSADEVELVELKLGLARAEKAKRNRLGMTPVGGLTERGPLR